MARRTCIVVLCIFITLSFSTAAAAGERLRLSSTTSTDNTGLLEYLLPVFEKKTGIKVDVIAVGTGKALKLAENGDVDVTLVHAPSKEKAFIDAGYGVDHHTVMANYFVVAGPAQDPAGVGRAGTAEEAFRKIARSQSYFVSRGDSSGTHIKEQHIWRAVLGKIPEGTGWYLESGKGMGETLTIADEKRGYTLSDSGTFLKYADKVDLKMLFVKPSDLLFNPYGIMAVNPAKNPHVNFEGASRLIRFMISEEGQRLIGDFRDPEGRRMFEPLVEGQSSRKQGNR